MPAGTSEGSRGRHTPAIPVVRTVVLPSKPSASAPAYPATSAPAYPATSAVPTERLPNADAVNKVLLEIKDTKNRVDQLALRLSLLDNSLKAQEKGVVALRQDYGALSQSVGGQTSEKLDGVAKQVKTLEDSFCEFSARIERGAAQLRDDVDLFAAENLGAVGGAARLDALLQQHDANLASLASQLRACEDVIVKTQRVPSSSEESTAAVAAWVQSTVVPDLKRILMEADRSEVVRVAAAAASEGAQAEIQAQLDRALICTVDLCATVLRPANGAEPGDRVLLRHPIKQVGQKTYMHRYAQGPLGEVLREAFPVDDPDGPYICFTPSEAASSSARC